MTALRNTLVILNPSTNPDGHERFAVWYNSIGVRSPDPGSLEKQEPWSIQGPLQSLPLRHEPRRDDDARSARCALWSTATSSGIRWSRSISTGRCRTISSRRLRNPLNPNLGRHDLRKWMEIYGRANAGAFDRYGWMYYSRDVFDFYGPFYWDTWPSLTGAIGMTYETDGGGHRGIVIRRDDGSLLSFRDGIAKHYVTALATIQATAERRRERVADYLAFRQGAINAGRTGTMKRVVFLPGSDPVRAAELAATLLRSGIEVRRIDCAIGVDARTCVQ